MNNKLDTNKLIQLYIEGKSYKEIIAITGYNRNSVYGFFIRRYGKLEDRNKSRRQSINITQEQKEILFGTLLGDGSLQKMGNSYLGRINHSTHQIEYCEYLHTRLAPLVYDIKYRTVSLPKYPNKVYSQCYFCFKPNEELKIFYEKFYSPKKDVPMDLSLLTPRAMAFWFMDDGRANGGCSIDIATCSFSLEGLLRLQQFLKDTYNLEVIITKDFRLYFSANSGRLFYQLISPYLIPSMEYKFLFVKKNSSADLKQGELLGTPTTEIVNEDNQQPSLSSNAFEGSETNSRILPGNAEDSNTNTSALPTL